MEENSNITEFNESVEITQLSNTSASDINLEENFSMEKLSLHPSDSTQSSLNDDSKYSSTDELPNKAISYKSEMLRMFGDLEGKDIKTIKNEEINDLIVKDSGIVERQISPRSDDIPSYNRGSSDGSHKTLQFCEFHQVDEQEFNEIDEQRFANAKYEDGDEKNANNDDSQSIEELKISETNSSVTHSNVVSLKKKFGIHGNLYLPRKEQSNDNNETMNKYINETTNIHEKSSKNRSIDIPSNFWEENKQNLRLPKLFPDRSAIDNLYDILMKTEGDNSRDEILQITIIDGNPCSINLENIDKPSESNSNRDGNLQIDEQLLESYIDFAGNTSSFNCSQAIEAIKGDSHVLKKMMFSRMFMDLKRLVGERERTIMWIENAQNEDSLKFLSFKSLHYQQTFIWKLKEAKSRLDKKINDIWTRLIDEKNNSLSPAQNEWIHSVSSSNFLRARVRSEPIITNTKVCIFGLFISSFFSLFLD
ncbi:unnamed protein product [Dracunculus medinensis]|uniref:Spc7 domain-containing protein n=1 Tax=Dracunculus medinensis TaxID=318479 RepID=A0A0N4UC68_DRAME|nr:unnamed protein product [Dracunculus medinensis]